MQSKSVFLTLAISILSTAITHEASASPSPTLFTRPSPTASATINELMNGSLGDFQIALPTLDRNTFDTTTDQCTLLKPSDLVPSFVSDLFNDFFIKDASHPEDGVYFGGFDELFENLGNNPFGFPFGDACIRHDFGYRNFKRQGLCGDKYRRQIDITFKNDMMDVCDKQDGLGQKLKCAKTAYAYFAGVRIGGGSAFC